MRQSTKTGFERVVEKIVEIPVEMVVHIEVPGEIAKALAVNTTLTALYLYDNSLGEGAGRSIGQALGVNTTLTQLDLGHNSFRKRGGQAIGKALAVNTTLTQLELAGNSLREGGGQAIGHALALNTPRRLASRAFKPLSVPRRACVAIITTRSCALKCLFTARSRSISFNKGFSSSVSGLHPKTIDTSTWLSCSACANLLIPLTCMQLSARSSVVIRLF